MADTALGGFDLDLFNTLFNSLLFKTNDERAPLFADIQAQQGGAFRKALQKKLKKGFFKKQRTAFFLERDIAANTVAPPQPTLQRLGFSGAASKSRRDQRAQGIKALGSFRTPFDLPR